MDPDWRPKLQTSKYPLQEVQDNVALGMIIRWQVAKRTICEDSLSCKASVYTHALQAYDKTHGHAICIESYIKLLSSRHAVDEPIH